jgi:hypothetical protein
MSQDVYGNSWTQHPQAQPSAQQPGAAQAPQYAYHPNYGWQAGPPNMAYQCQGMNMGWFPPHQGEYKRRGRRGERRRHRRRSSDTDTYSSSCSAHTERRRSSRHSRRHARNRDRDRRSQMSERTDPRTEERRDDRPRPTRTERASPVQEGPSRSRARPHQPVVLESRRGFNDSPARGDMDGTTSTPPRVDPTWHEFLMPHEELNDRLQSVWNQELHPEYAPSIGRLRGHRSYEIHMLHYCLPAPDPRKEVMGALSFHLDRYNWLMSRYNTAKSELHTAELVLNSTQSRKPVGAADSEEARQAQEAMEAALTDSHCLHQMMTAERLALGNATIAARKAGVRHQLPKDLEVPLQTPPGFREAWRQGAQTHAARDTQRAHQKRWPLEYHRGVVAHHHKKNRPETRRQQQPWKDNQEQAGTARRGHPRPSDAEINEVREKYRWLGRTRVRGIVRHFSLRGSLPRNLDASLEEDQQWAQTDHDPVPPRSHASSSSKHQEKAKPNPTTATSKTRGDAPTGRPRAATTPSVRRHLPDHLLGQSDGKHPPPTMDNSTSHTGGSDDAPAAAPSQAPAQGKNADDGAASASDSTQPADKEPKSDANNTAGASPLRGDEVDYDQ